MSMREYAVDDYGMVLNTNCLQMIASRVCSDYSDEEWDKSVESRYEYVDEVVDKLAIEYISEFDGEAFPINDKGESEWRDAEAYSNDIIYFIPLSHYPNLFRVAYVCMEDVISEIKNKIGGYLPENFDYRGSIRHISGTYFG